MYGFFIFLIIPSLCEKKRSAIRAQFRCNFAHFAYLNCLVTPANNIWVHAERKLALHGPNVRAKINLQTQCKSME